MSRTILSAAYANADHTAAIAETEEAGAVLLSAADTPEAWDAMLAALTPEAFVAPPIPPPVLTARQLRLGLLGLGVQMAQVDAALAAIPDATAREAARIEWEYATTYERAHPLVAAIGTALGLTEEQIGAAWTQAATL